MITCASFEVRSYRTDAGQDRWSAALYHTVHGRGQSGFRSQADAEAWVLRQVAEIQADRDAAAERPHQMSIFEQTP